MLRRTLALLCVARCGGLSARPMRLDRDGCSYKFVPATGMYKRETGDGRRGLILKVHKKTSSRLEAGASSVGRAPTPTTRVPRISWVTALLMFRRLPMLKRATGRSRSRRSGFDITPRPPDVTGLSEASADVLLRGETEKPHSGVTADGVAWTEVPNLEGPVVFCCAASGLPVFASEDIVASTTGWPSFERPIAEDHVIYRPDGGERRGALRRESHASWPCHRRGARTRYCINAAALTVNRIPRPVASARTCRRLSKTFCDGESYPRLASPWAATGTFKIYLINAPGSSRRRLVS